MKLKTITLPCKRTVSPLAILNWLLFFSLLSIACFLVIKNYRNFSDPVYVLFFYLKAFLVKSLLKDLDRFHVSEKEDLQDFDFSAKKISQKNFKKKLSFSLKFIEKTYNRKISVPCFIVDDTNALAALYQDIDTNEYFIGVHSELFIRLEMNEKYLCFVLLHEEGHRVHRDITLNQMLSHLIIFLSGFGLTLYPLLLFYSTTSRKLSEYAADHFASCHCGKENSIETLSRLPREHATLSFKNEMLSFFLGNHPAVSMRIKFLRTFSI